MDFLAFSLERRIFAPTLFSLAVLAAMFFPANRAAAESKLLEPARAAMRGQDYAAAGLQQSL